MENKILDLFLYKHRLKFNELEKGVNERSNKVSYHVSKLMRKGVLVKDGDYYELSEVAEEIIPYLSSKRAVLPVVLIHLGDKNRCFLWKRDKRPYCGKLSLPGGRMLVGEDVGDAVERIMKDKFNIKVKLSKVNSISVEHVKKNGKVIHGFLLIFVSGKYKGDVELTSVGKNRKDIIKSDYKLIKGDLGKEVKVKRILSKG